MRVCTYRGLVIAILTRNEHCPPHVHIDAGAWQARFKFSFWDNSVKLWDVIPVKNTPKSALLEELRQHLRQGANLRRARELWLGSRKLLCLINKHWNLVAQVVLDQKSSRDGSLVIESALFDAAANKTFLKLADQARRLEIQL